MADSAYILGKAMSRCGVKTEAAGRAQDALEELRQTPDIDLMITDLRMPGMSGQSLIREIRGWETETHSPRRLPILVLTGEGSPEERVACLGQYGADDYLLKPVKMQELIKAAENVLMKARTGSSQDRKVLVVEDDTVSRRLLSAILRKCGETPVGCGSVAEATLELDSNYEKYKAVFLDSQLPDGMGVDVLIHLQNSGKKPPLPVVSMSGGSEDELRRLYAGHSIYAYLEKPVSKSALLHVLRSIR